MKTGEKKSQDKKKCFFILDLTAGTRGMDRSQAGLRETTGVVLTQGMGTPQISAGAGRDPLSFSRETPHPPGVLQQWGRTLGL